MQQLRYAPTKFSDAASQALSRLVVLPGSKYTDPEFSWKWAVAPAAIGFAGAGLGAGHANDLFVGAARTFLDGGYLFEFKFSQDRQHFAFSDSGLADKVDDNACKFDEGQSSSLVVGKDFGMVTNIVTGPDGNLYVTSLTNGRSTWSATRDEVGNGPGREALMASRSGPVCGTTYEARSSDRARWPRAPDGRCGERR